MKLTEKQIKEIEAAITEAHQEDTHTEIVLDVSKLMQVKIKIGRVVCQQCGNVHCRDADCGD